MNTEINDTPGGGKSVFYGNWRMEQCCDFQQNKVHLKSNLFDKIAHGQSFWRFIKYSTEFLEYSACYIEQKVRGRYINEQSWPILDKSQAAINMLILFHWLILSYMLYKCKISVSLPKTKQKCYMHLRQKRSK